MLGAISFSDIKKLYAKRPLVESNDELLFIQNGEGENALRIEVDATLTSRLNQCFKKSDSFLMVDFHNIPLGIRWHRCFFKDSTGQFLYDIYFEMRNDMLFYYHNKYDLLSESECDVVYTDEWIAIFSGATRTCLDGIVKKREYRLLHETGLLRLPVF